MGYCATFTIFSDYMRNSIRLAALAQCGTIFVTTHDSIAVGEDGPTHQPIETIPSLRMIPDLTVIRPADCNETSGAYKVAVEKSKLHSMHFLQFKYIYIFFIHFVCWERYNRLLQYPC